MWLCSAGQKDSLNRTFEASASGNDRLRFIGADKRQAGADPMKNMSASAHAQTVLFFEAPLLVSEAVYGCVSPNALIPGAIVMALTGADKELTNAITDDRPTAEFMKSFKGPSAILFGAGHFEEMGASGTSMRDLLTQGGQSIVVIDIFKDAASWNAEKNRDQSEAKKDKTILPDAVLYLNPPADNPDGIEIINPALKKLLSPTLKAPAV
jgi:hypothetical protein